MNSMTEFIEKQTIENQLLIEKIRSLIVFTNKKRGCPFRTASFLLHEIRTNIWHTTKAGDYVIKMSFTH